VGAGSAVKFAMGVRMAALITVESLDVLKKLPSDPEIKVAAELFMIANG